MLGALGEAWTPQWSLDHRPRALHGACGAASLQSVCLDLLQQAAAFAGPQLGCTLVSHAGRAWRWEHSHLSTSACQATAEASVQTANCSLQRRQAACSSYSKQTSAAPGVLHQLGALDGAHLKQRQHSRGSSCSSPRVLSPLQRRERAWRLGQSRTPTSTSDSMQGASPAPALSTAAAGAGKAQRACWCVLQLARHHMPPPAYGHCARSRWALG